MDSSGSIWTANSGNNTISKFIGLAAPVTTLSANVGPNLRRHIWEGDAILVYDDQSVLVNSISRTAIVTVDEQHKEVMMKPGMHMHQEISVPMKGHYGLRAGIHDHMGAVKLPLDNVKPAVTATAPTPTSTAK